MKSGLTQAGYWMLKQHCIKPLVCSALLMMIGGGEFLRTYAQQPRPPSNGALAGRLTDIHSAPLENMTITLRNAVTGAEVRTTTEHGGKYHFTGLAQGEYVLTAKGAGGTGRVDGIFIAAGHEQRVQAAMDLVPA